MTEKKIPPLPEAPASLNFRGITQNGWNVQFTLRDSSEENLLTRFGLFIGSLEKNYKVVPEGMQPAGNGSQNTGELPKIVADPPGTEPQEMQSFEATELVHKSGKSWGVKGGKFTQYGVTIWPEVLEDAGIMPNELDTSLVYPLQNYTAYYNELTEKGYPKKIVKLAKA